MSDGWIFAPRKGLHYRPKDGDGFIPFESDEYLWKSPILTDVQEYGAIPGDFQTYFYLLSDGRLIEFTENFDIQTSDYIIREVTEEEMRERFRPRDVRIPGRFRDYLHEHYIIFTLDEGDYSSALHTPLPPFHFALPAPIRPARPADPGPEALGPSDGSSSSVGSDGPIVPNVSAAQQARASEAEQAAGSGGTRAPDPSKLVTLDQAAAIVNKSKRALEYYKTKGTLPEPAVEGGGGKAALYDWTILGPWLTEQFGIDLPERFPGRKP